MNSYEALTACMSLKAHFTTDYDYFKYNGKIGSAANAYAKLSDSQLYPYIKISKHRDPVRYILANLLYDIKSRPANFDEDIYTSWLKRQQSLAYLLQQELALFEGDFDSAILVTAGQHPELLRLVLADKVSLESLVVLDDLCGFFKYWNKKINDTSIWPSIHFKAVKYSPFIQYNSERIKKVIVESF
jgi:hypothetical protein